MNPNKPRLPASPGFAKGRDWKKAIAPYQRPDILRSSWQLVNSIVPYLALWYVAYRLIEVSVWASLAASVVASGFLIRIFIIAHDCGHGSFFRSRKANAFWGAITSALPCLPYRAWRHEHAVHHAHSGDLDNRGMGDIDTLTVKEYLSSSPWRRLRYRLYRNPLVMLGLGPIFTFMLHYRFWRSDASREVRMSVLRTDVVLGVAVVVLILMIGWRALLMVQLPIMAIAGAVGIWLFYVQHQFEGVYWERHEDWDYFQQAVHGSSHYDLPRVLQWFTGNIGFHHVHHLGARIPNYHLEKCHRELELFRDVRPIGLFESFRCLKFRLWDEDARRLVGFGEIREFASQQARS